MTAAGCPSGAPRIAASCCLPFRARDWDYLGWRYSLLSSIATGGWNNVLNMIPARDPDGRRHFSAGGSRLVPRLDRLDERAQGIPAAHAADPRSAGARPGRRYLRRARQPRLRVPVQPERPAAHRGVRARRVDRTWRPRRVRAPGSDAARRAADRQAWRRSMDHWGSGVDRARRRHGNRARDCAGGATPRVRCSSTRRAAPRSREAS